jgi:hypothetical protein
MSQEAITINEPGKSEYISSGDIVPHPRVEHAQHRRLFALSFPVQRIRLRNFGTNCSLFLVKIFPNGIYKNYCCVRNK